MASWSDGGQIFPHISVAKACGSPWFNYILREIPKTHFMEFGLLYENNVVLNDFRMADIRLSSLV